MQREGLALNGLEDRALELSRQGRTLNGANSTSTVIASPEPGPTPLGPSVEPQKQLVASMSVPPVFSTPKLLLPLSVLSKNTWPAATVAWSCRQPTVPFLKSEHSIRPMTRRS